MGRPKGSKNKPKVKAVEEEKTSKRVVHEETTFIGRGQDGAQPIQLVQQVERYTFRNLGPGMFFVTARFGGVTKQIPPGTTRDDISLKEREQILTSQMYRDGIIIEELNEDIEQSISPNSLNDKQIKKLLLMDNDDIKSHILEMDSIFSLNRLKEKLLEQDLPAYLLSLIDSRIEEIRAKYEEDHIAPIDSRRGDRE